jgi:SAM-dependent methyltransferase
MMNPAEFATLSRSESDLWWFRGMRKILFELLDAYARRLRPTRVLEAGCGTGYFARHLAERYAWNIFPADLSADGLSIAHSRGLSRLCQADIADCPFRTESFDVLLSLDVLVHFAAGQETAALAEFHRMLTPGGLLVLRVSALNFLRSRHSEFTHERQRFTRGSLERLVREHGFRVLRCTYANSLLLPVAIARFRIWEPLLRKPPASGTGTLAPWLDRLLFTPLAVEAALIRRGFDFPAGQSLILIGEKL